VAKTTPNGGSGFGVINKNNGLYYRDYVFTARSKDIKTNWPFSLKNLQLCSKHGVKDVLPPFQYLDKVRSQPFERCTAESSTLVENKNLSNSNGEPSTPNDHAELEFSENGQLNQKPEEACIETIGLKGKMISHPQRQVSYFDIESPLGVVLANPLAPWGCRATPWCPRGSS
jgi:hypothetical protein